jgi:glutathione synthase/RimK-type ligase-like ATP-grasp enzyme
MINRLAWVTADEARGRDPDEALALARLAEAGVSVDVVNWDERSVDWSSYPRVIIRSPWDYQDRPAEFLRWLEHVEQVTDLRNPVAPMRWSLDKHYLADLDRAGVPVTPTSIVAPGETAQFPSAAWVVKPSVGAGSRDVAVYRRGDESIAHDHVGRLHARGVSALVQPLLTSVAVDGEWPMVFFGGRFSHTANKRVRLPNPTIASADGDSAEELFATETNSPYAATREQIGVAERAMVYVHERFGVLTYARVDLVRDDDGNFCVLEVELVEPSLFLPEGGPDAVRRCVEALIA